MLRSLLQRALLTLDNPWLGFLVIYLFDRDVALSKAMKVLFYVIPHGLGVCKWHGVELGDIFCLSLLGASQLVL